MSNDYVVTNWKAGLKAEVTWIRKGLFAVTLTDLDSGRSLEPAFRFTREDAEAYARKCAEVFERDDTCALCDEGDTDHEH